MFTVLDSVYRNRRWELEDDPGNDLDNHSEVRHPGHLSGGNDSQGGPAALVPEEDGTLQECQCSKLPSQVGFLYFCSFRISVRCGKYCCRKSKTEI